MMADPSKQTAYTPRNRKERRRALALLTKKPKYGVCRKLTKGRKRPLCIAYINAVKSLFRQRKLERGRVLHGLGVYEKSVLPKIKLNGRHRR